MLKIYNNNKTNTPNVLHFQGDTLTQLQQTFDCIKDKNTLLNTKVPENLTLVSCWTDDTRCHILKQCNEANIELINAVPFDYDTSQHWDMRNKIRFIVNTLKNINTEYTMIMDGYDVLIIQLEDIMEKFNKIGYRILFNATSNNFPNVQIDTVPQRFLFGEHRFFNAGCCIGYTKDLLNFYNETLDILEYNNFYNPYHSEQFIVRHAFAKYSNDITQKYIFFDYNSLIFQTMGRMTSTGYAVDETYKDIVITLDKIETQEKKKVMVTGSDGFIGSRLSEYLLQTNEYEVICVDRKHKFEVDEAIGIFRTKNIDIVFHLAAQTSVWNNDIDQIKKDNIDSFIKLATACNEYGVKLVYASSSTANVLNTTSMYGISKRFNEEFAKIYCPLATGVRLHNVYGLNPRKDTLLWHCLNDEVVTLYNKGANKRSFTYIDDVVAALICASKSKYKLVNCCSKDNICTTNEFVDKVSKYKPIIKKLVQDKKYMDNEEQVINDNIPNILTEYTSIDEGLKRLFNELKQLK